MYLECNNISKSYSQGSFFSRKPSFKVLDGLSFSMKEGRSAGLLGCNGSGKSTLTRIILGLEEPDSGSVILDGLDIHKSVKNEDFLFRKSMQAVFQDAGSAMNPAWNAFQVIKEPLDNFYSKSIDECEEIVTSLMESVGLDHFEMYKNVTKFSGGQQQRICIARSLALNPSILVLDEAVSNLDMVIQAQIINLLKDLKSTRGITMLIISHDLRVIFQLCDDIAVLDGGKIVENLSVEEGFSKSTSEVFNKLYQSILPV